MNETTGKIKALRVTDAVFSYSYLTAPRPEGQFKAGSYGTELIIKDEETIKLINQYLKEVVQTAIKETWNGKLPKDVYLPFEEGDEEVETEAGAYVLKTTSPTQPPLYIREAGQAWPRRLEGEEVSEIYAGMIGEAYVVLSPFNYLGKTGITAYINGVCKTADGTPFGGRANLEEVFAVPSEAAMDFSAPVKPSKGKTVEKAPEPEKEPEIDLATLTKRHTKQPAAVEQTTQQQQTTRSSKKLSVQDLL